MPHKAFCTCGAVLIYDGRAPEGEEWYCSEHPKIEGHYLGAISPNVVTYAMPGVGVTEEVELSWEDMHTRPDDKTLEMKAEEPRRGRRRGKHERPRKKKDSTEDE